ncbi:Mediator of RNA polymerase II transcription subunit 14 [Cladobotryum mycophilum]|uniref:Mediator of RNA polymerase II transcription subunit 14 n=1 Tax=Cladobotryum mycophilum TaxID=491253 RepID=A0ABR0S749_9HYPO
MENGGQNGVRTDHPRDTTLNGINGVKGVDKPRPASDKGKAVLASNDDGANIVNGEVVGPLSRQRSNSPVDRTSRMNDLPDEIIHITQGFVPLSLLLTRLAQTTHNSLQEKIAELAKMPIPAAAMNGNTNYVPSAPDDTSNENIRKKANLLHFTQDMHSKWVKALVIMEWSRKASKVSKLIDLKFLLDQQRILYDAGLDNIINVKRDLTYARMPSPDLKTALQILSTGTAPWMPDLQYIEPPSLTPEEQLKWINDLNTLLSLRLNLEDYDKIPFHFRKYEISSGRVTFKVPGEFEVDLTIADEDFGKQFWFIDFRYAFSPAASSLPESLRVYLEGCINDVLAKDGLSGCYQFLHEFVLTSKINELKRQAMQLSRSSWSGTLVVEPLNRALAIQYWTSRNPATGLKSWVLVAVNSGRKPDGRPDPKSSSQLTAKWYRDNKEVKDVDIELDVENLSAETLLKTVVGRHIEHILSSIHDRLLAAPRFKNREAGMTLRISSADPGASSLAIQVGYRGSASLLIEPTTGAFAVKPQSKFSIQHEHQLNVGKFPAEDGMTCLENVRCGITEDELNRQGSSMGWFIRKAPMNPEELRAITKVRDWTRTVWLQKEGWGSSWFVVVFLSLGGDEWWLLEVNSNEPLGSPRFNAKLPMNKGHPDLSGAFWTNLTLFATGMITQSVDTRELHRQRIRSKINDNLNLSLPQQVRLPSIEVALSELFPAMVPDDSNKMTAPIINAAEVMDNIELLSLINQDAGAPSSSKRTWAHNNVAIRFKGVQCLSPPREGDDGNVLDRELMCTSDAIIRVKRPSKFLALNGLVDRDVSYCPSRGEFCLRIRRSATEPILGYLKPRIKAIDRFVNFLEAMDRAKGAITSESVTLRKVTFAYGNPVQDGKVGGNGTPPRRWRVVMDLSKDEIDVEIEKGNPHLRVIDLMRRLVNKDGGIGALMAWLPVSLPALMAIEKMESEWDELSTRSLGQLEFSMKTITWMNLSYNIFGPNGTGPQKRVSLDIRIKARRGEAWWHAWRSDTDATGGPQEDEFTRVLKPIWDAKGDNWLGLATSAAGKPDGGVAGMLLAIDDAIREVAPTPGAEVAMMGTAATAGPFSQQGGSANAAVVILD